MNFVEFTWIFLNSWFLRNAWPTHGWTDGRTKPLIELLFATKNCIQILCIKILQNFGVRVNRYNSQMNPYHLRLIDAHIVILLQDVFIKRRVYSCKTNKIISKSKKQGHHQVNSCKKLWILLNLLNFNLIYFDFVEFAILRIFETHWWTKPVVELLFATENSVKEWQTFFHLFPKYIGLRDTIFKATYVLGFVIFAFSMQTKVLTWQQSSDKLGSYSFTDSHIFPILFLITICNVQL